MIYLTDAAAALDLGLVQQFVYDLPEKALNLGIRIVYAMVVFFIGTQIINFVRRFIKKAMQRTEAEQGVITFVDSFVKAGMYIVLALFIASYFGVDAASVIALVGSAGVAIGLAVQGSLSNLAGGVLLLLLKPFVVGDYIIDSAGMEGTVEEIQIFFTLPCLLYFAEYISELSVVDYNAVIKIKSDCLFCHNLKTLMVFSTLLENLAVVIKLAAICC